MFLEIIRISVPVYVMVPSRTIKRNRNGRQNEGQREDERKELRERKPSLRSLITLHFCRTGQAKGAEHTISGARTLQAGISC